MSEISRLKEISDLTGITVGQLMTISTLENPEKIIDVLANGSSMWGDHGLNGHFWCEMPDGTIIDEWFDKYDEYRISWKIKNKTLIHYPCKNPITNAVMIKKARTLVNDLGGDEINTLLYGKNVEKCCMYNAIANCHKHGGTLRFGSLGLTTDCGGITFWIFGNEEFSTFNDFTKECDGSVTVRNQKKAELYCLKLGVNIGMFKTFYL